MRRIRLRTPAIPFERVKRAVGIILLAAFLEYVDPLPLFKSTAGILLYIWFIFETVKQFLAYKLETSYEAVARAEQYKRQWRAKLEKYDPLSRYRLRRLIILIIGFFAYGQTINIFTTKCDNAVSCAVFSIDLLLAGIPLLLRIMIGIFFGIVQFAAMFWYLSTVGFIKTIEPGTVDVTFDDVYGQDKAKELIIQQQQLLENDTEVAKAGGHLQKGILLVGPPGTGKTMLAKAFANASSKPLLLVPPGGFASTFIGINFIKVLRLGRMIRKLSRRWGGVTVFIDEIDSLGMREGVEGEPAEWEKPHNPYHACTAVSEPRHVVVTGGGGGGMNMGTLEAFLAMMDGMEEPRGLTNNILKFFGFKPLPPPKTKVFFLGATNRPSRVDPALKREGRFGRQITVDYPKYEGKLATYQGYLSKYEHALTEEDIEYIARLHYHGTGAEIEGAVNEALLRTFREGDHAGLITRDDIMWALIEKRVGAAEGVFENDANVWGVAVHEAGHAVLFHILLRDHLDIWFASIEQRGQRGGVVVPAPRYDDWKKLRSQLISEIAVSLGSRIAEQLLLGEMSNGHGGDGQHSTDLAEKMVYWGHTFRLTEDGPEGQLSYFGYDDTHMLREQLLVEAYQKADKLLAEYKDAVEAVAQLLYEHHTVEGYRIHELLEGEYGL